MLHVDTKCFPLLKNENKRHTKEYQGTPEHLFVKTFYAYLMNQKFTNSACLQTSSKSERVILTFMEIWHEREMFANYSG